jgi:hypothetical protein
MTEEYSVEECIEAGTYWFGRSDLEAAEAWWRRALEMDPGNAKALECLRLVKRSTKTGYKDRSWSTGATPEPSPFSNPQAPGLADRPYLEPAAVDPDEPPGESEGSMDLSSLDLPDEPTQPGVDDPTAALSGPAGGTAGVLEEMPLPEHEPVTEHAPPSHTGSWPSVGPGPRSGHVRTASGVRMTTDPLDFASEAPAAGDEPRSEEPSPWDTGPAFTSPMVIEDEEAFDAVAEHTPLPSVELEGYFDRYPSTQEEIKDYLRATGDLPVAPDEPMAPRPEVSSDPLRVAKDKFALHDFDGVIDELDGLQGEHQTEEVRALLAEARAQLTRMYESKIGDFDRVPRIHVSDEEVIWLNLNHRAGFILSQIDGSVTFEDLVALSGMPRLDTLKILAELIQQRVIE